MSLEERDNFDVIVVGAGTAGSSAALSAREQGARVLILEKAPRSACGGNGRFTGGGFRFTHKGNEELLPYLTEIPESELNLMDIMEYSADEFYSDLMRVTDGLADPFFCELIVKESNPVFKWINQQGMKWDVNYDMGTRVGDRINFSKGATPLGVKGGGEGFVESMLNIAESKGIEVRYETKVVNLLTDDHGKVCGVRVNGHEGLTDIHSQAVILASGGFSSNAEMRAKYLGKSWDMVKMRGTMYNTGEGLKMALTIGAQPVGEWSGCHATQIDLNAPDVAGGLSTDRKSYIYGILVNMDGKRFADEGEDFHAYTYAKMGRKVLEMPNGIAFQIFDAKVIHLLMSDYAKQVPVQANSIEELAQELDIDPVSLAKTVQEFNDAVQDTPFDPAKMDGKCTKGITPPKTNWAQKIDTPPFRAYPVTTGITFTFGGIKIDKKAQVLDTEGKTIPGLYANGEIVGGIFYRNYCGGAGITKNLVLGRIAGMNAARLPR